MKCLKTEWSSHLQGMGHTSVSSWPHCWVQKWLGHWHTPARMAGWRPISRPDTSDVFCHSQTPGLSQPVSWVLLPSRFETHPWFAISLYCVGKKWCSQATSPKVNQRNNFGIKDETRASSVRPGCDRKGCGSACRTRTSGVAVCQNRNEVWSWERPPNLEAKSDLGDTRLFAPSFLQKTQEQLQVTYAL